MATFPGGYPPPPPPPAPGYGYPPPAAQSSVPPNPWLNPAAPVKSAGPSWPTVVLLVLMTAAASVIGTLLLTHQTKPSALGNGESTNGPAVVDTLTADADMANDLRTASIAEQAYATNNLGKYVSDQVQLGDAAANHALVQQGLRLTGPDTIEASVFTVNVASDSYCLRAVSTQSPTIWYLSSSDNVVTRVKPLGCS